MSIGQYTGAPSGNGMTGIRKYLNDQGYKDDQIGYSNGNVSLNGKRFINATPAADGSTYAAPSALQGALKQYNTGNNSAMANNLNNNMYNNVTQQPFQFKQQQSPFSYDPNSDQAYQAALKSAQQNIQTGQNNTLANLLAHGQGNSSYAASATQQIANKEMGNVSNNILPQLISQAYQRYQDQNNNDYRNQAANYGVGQDQFKNQSALSNYFNGLGQQDFNNNIATNQDTRAGAAQDANFSGYYTNPNTSAIQRAMQENSAAYASASPEQQKHLHDDNLKLAASIGGHDATGNGDYSYGPTRTLAGQNQDFNQQLGLGNQKIAQQNADSMEQERKDMGAYRQAEAARQMAIANGQIGLGRQSNNIAQQKYDQENNARSIEGEVYGHANDFQTAQDVNDYFNANGSYLTKNLGSTAVENMKKSFLAPFNADNKQGNSDYNKALSMAQKDPRWLMDGNDKKALVKEYQDLMN